MRISAACDEPPLPARAWGEKSSFFFFLSTDAAGGTRIRLRVCCPGFPGLLPTSASVAQDAATKPVLFRASSVPLTELPCPPPPPRSSGDERCRVAGRNFFKNRAVRILSLQILQPLRDLRCGHVAVARTSFPPSAPKVTRLAPSAQRQAASVLRPKDHRALRSRHPVRFTVVYRAPTVLGPSLVPNSMRTPQKGDRNIQLSWSMARFDYIAAADGEDVIGANA